MTDPVATPVLSVLAAHADFKWCGPACHPGDREDRWKHVDGPGCAKARARHEAAAGPTADQIRAYLAVTGWTIGDSGRAAALWMRYGARVRLVHQPNDYDLDKAVFDIAIAEDRHPADVHGDILDVDNPIHARVRAAVISSMCERAAAIVHRQVADGSDNGFPGVWNADLAYAMSQQDTMLADVLEKTAAVIKAAAGLDPPAPWHLWWTAVGNAAAAIVQAEPTVPDDIDRLRARLDAMRAAKTDDTGQREP